MWKVVNTTNDRMKAHLHRLATKMLDAPVIGEVRLRVGAPILLEDAQFEEHKEQLDKWREKGILDYWQVDADGQPENKPEDGDEPDTQPGTKKAPVPNPQSDVPTDTRTQEEKDKSATGELDRTGEDNPLVDPEKAAREADEARVREEALVEQQRIEAVAKAELDAQQNVNPEPWAEASTTPETPETSTTKKGPKKKLF